MALIVMTSNEKQFGESLKRGALSLNSVALGRKLRIKWSDEMEKINRSHFKTKGHGSWDPLNKKYAKRKRAGGFGDNILRRTDGLFRSVTSKAFGNKTTIVRTGHGFNYTFATTDPLADFHHRGRGRLPVRTVIDPTLPQENRLQRIGGKIIGNHLVRAMAPFARIKGNAFKVTSPMTGNGTEN